MSVERMERSAFWSFLLIAIAAQGCGAERSEDLIEVQSDESALASPAFSVKTFRPWPGYSIGAGPDWLTGDLNGDGKTDLVHLVSDYAHTWIANGDGSFTIGTYLPWPGYDVHAGRGWRTGDLNGDGKTDLIHLVSDYVHTWISKGDGSFAVSSFRPWSGYGIGVGPDWLSGDLNGDGRTDLVHLVSDYIHTWISRGDGSFAVGTFRPWSGYATSAGRGWHLGDLNGDGKADLVHLVSDYVHTWISNGNGSFAVGTYSPWPGYDVHAGRGWRSGDLNGDGKMDLIHLVSDYVHTWISKGDGSFTISWFRPWSGYGIGVGPDWLSGDLNGDGRMDLVHLVSDDVHTWISNGTGGFAVGLFRPWSGYATSAGRGWRVGDLNGDGRTDLVHLVTDYVHPWMTTAY